MKWVLPETLREDQKQPPELFYKKVLLKILQNWQENTCVRVFFEKVAGLSFNYESDTSFFLWILRNF